MSVKQVVRRTSYDYYDSVEKRGSVLIFDLPTIPEEVESIVWDYELGIRIWHSLAEDESYSVTRVIFLDYYYNGVWTNLYSNETHDLIGTASENKKSINIKPKGMTSTQWREFLNSIAGGKLRVYSKTYEMFYDEDYHGGWYFVNYLNYKTPTVSDPTCTINYAAQTVTVKPNTTGGSSQDIIVNGSTYTTTNNNSVTVPFSNFNTGNNTITTTAKNAEYSNSGYYTFVFPQLYPTTSELYVTNDTNTVDDVTTISFSASNYDLFNVFVNDVHVATNTKTIPRSAFIVGTNKIKVGVDKYHEGVKFVTWTNTVERLYSKKYPTITEFAPMQNTAYIEDTIGFRFGGTGYDMARIIVNGTQFVADTNPYYPYKSSFVIGENNVTLKLMKNKIDNITGSESEVTMDLKIKVFKKDCSIDSFSYTNATDSVDSDTVLKWQSYYVDYCYVYANGKIVGEVNYDANYSGSSTFTIPKGTLKIGLNSLNVVAFKKEISGVANSGNNYEYQQVVMMNGEKPAINQLYVLRGSSIDEDLTIAVKGDGNQDKIRVYLDTEPATVYLFTVSDKTEKTFTLTRDRMKSIGFGVGYHRITAYAYKTENGLTLRSDPKTCLFELDRKEPKIENFVINKTSNPISISYKLSGDYDSLKLYVNGALYKTSPLNNTTIPNSLLTQATNTITLKASFTYYGENRDVESTRIYLVKRNNVNFDYYGRYKKPNLTLCTPNLKPLYSMGAVAFNVRPTLRYNAISEVEFTVPRRTNLGEEVKWFDKVVGNRVALLEGIGYFILQDPVIENDGVTETKTVIGYSLEYDLTQKTINLFSGYYKFYDPVAPEGTLLYEVINMNTVKGWKIGKVSQSLWGKYREYSITDQTVYGFLTQTVANAIECVFDFDYLNKEVNVLDVDDATTETDISLSFNNLVKNIGIEELSDQFATAMTCIGGGELTVDEVNPLGGSMIYNFSHFTQDTSGDWMSEDLRLAVLAWEQGVKDELNMINSLRSNYRLTNEDLIKLKSQLVDEQSKRTAKESVLRAQIDGGYDTETTYNEIMEIQKNIDDYKYLIAIRTVEANNYLADVTSLVKSLQMNNYFTEEQIVELNSYIKEKTYTNDTFVKTSIMDVNEVQEVALEFYDHCVGVLEKISKPKYSFSLDAVNILFLEEFSHFANQLKCGCQVQVDMENGTFNYPVLLEMQYNYDDPTDFELTFSSGLRLSKNDDKFSDLYSNSVTTSTTVSAGEAIYKDFANNYQNQVSDFINNEFDCSAKEIVNSSNQEIKFGENGIICKKLKDNGEYDGKQLWIVNNKIVMTKDGFKTVSTCVGETSTGAYGICAELIAGNLLCGNELMIHTEDGSFTIDNEGAKLVNAALTVVTKSEDNKIILNPDDGIKIQKFENGGYVDQFYIDINTGDAMFRGNITGASGTFSGALNVANGIFSVDTNGKCIAKEFYAQGGQMSGVQAFFGNTATGFYTEISSSGEIDFYTNGKSSMRVVSFPTQGGCLMINDANGGESFRVQSISSTESNIVTSTKCTWQAFGAGIVVNGNFAVAGSKNAVVPTQHYGVRALYATEADRSYFTTNGNAKTESLSCRIDIDPMFMETIELNSTCPYIVTVTPYSDSRVWVDEIHDDYIIVKSDKDTAFSYEVMATRISYGEVYMEENTILSKSSLEKIQEEVVNRMK